MKKSKFKLTHLHSTTLDAGYLVPFLIQPTLPNDTFHIGLSTFIRAQPLLAPLMHEVKLYTQYWYVPYRLLWDNWEEFITGGQELNYTPTFPTVKANKSDAKVGSLWDYLGFPTVEGVEVSAMPFRAMALIFNTRYRDEDLQTEIPISFEDGLDTITSRDLLSPSFSKDYFTIARPYTQRGADIFVPVLAGGDSPTIYREKKIQLEKLVSNYNAFLSPWITALADEIYNIHLKEKASITYVRSNVSPTETYKFTPAKQGKSEWIRILEFLFLNKGGTGNPSQLTVTPDDSPLGSIIIYRGTTPNIDGLTSTDIDSALRTGAIYDGKLHSLATASFKVSSAQFNWTITCPVVYKGQIESDNEVPNASTSSTAGTITTLTQGGFLILLSGLSNATPPGSYVVAYQNSGSSGKISIRDLRQSSALQRYAERSLKYGNRYEEFIAREFGISPRDSRIQRPEYIGGGSGILNISEVLQTAESTDTGVGTMRGHGIGAISQRRIRFKSVEHGIIIGLLSIRPKSVYTQGVEREFLKRSRLDFFTPELANIGMQEVLTQELYADATNAGHIFGYSDRYQEYRYHKPLVTGEFRGNLSFWNMARVFKNQPELNDEFINMKHAVEDFKRPFQIQDNSAHSFVVMLKNHIRAYRPIPKRAREVLK